VPVWREEDGHASVAILQRRSRFGPPVHALYINGTHQASDNPTMVGYHRLIGTLPMAFGGLESGSFLIIMLFGALWGFLIELFATPIFTAPMKRT
jgi:hypothetical protein